MTKLWNVLKKYSTATLLLGLVITALVIVDTPPPVNKSATVMITSMNGKSGGSGVVIKSDKNESEILTNAHVCGLLKYGGLVTTAYGEAHVAKEYKIDDYHDLCLVTVAANLKNVAKMADTAPSLYEEQTIDGHPNLLPNVVTKGHFAGTRIIQVFIGIDKCTEEQQHDIGDTGSICAFFGGIPKIKTYEANVVTALIMAGSSGSAVYNKKGDLTGLAFAGSGDLSYAFTVPYNYVATFLNNTSGTRLGFKRPNYTLDFIEALFSKQGKEKRDLKQKCLGKTIGKIKNICDVIIEDVVW